MPSLPLELIWEIIDQSDNDEVLTWTAVSRETSGYAQKEYQRRKERLAALNCMGSQLSSQLTFIGDVLRNRATVAEVAALSSELLDKIRTLDGFAAEAQGVVHRRCKVEKAGGGSGSIGSTTASSSSLQPASKNVVLTELHKLESILHPSSEQDAETDWPDADRGREIGASLGKAAVWMRFQTRDWWAPLSFDPCPHATHI